MFSNVTATLAAHITTAVHIAGSSKSGQVMALPDAPTPTPKPGDLFNKGTPSKSVTSPLYNLLATTMQVAAVIAGIGALFFLVRALFNHKYFKHTIIAAVIFIILAAPSGFFNTVGSIWNQTTSGK